MKRLFLYTVIFALIGLSAVGCTSGDTEQETMESETSATLGGGEEGEIPESWQVRLDNPDPEVEISSDTASADIYFVNISPGMHITSGPAAIYWDSTNTISGDFQVSSTIHLFDPGELREAFGVFFGGRSLNSENQAYTYFLVRNGSQFLIKQRMGSETETLVPWTQDDAINAYTDTTESSAPNTLTVERSGANLSFSVNGTEVHSMPTDNIVTDGITGLRINHRLNVHVESFDIE